MPASRKPSVKPTMCSASIAGRHLRLRRYARSLVFDSATADDLVQTTLERALAHWHQFDQRRDLLVWVLSIAHNAHMDQRRRDPASRWSIPSVPVPSRMPSRPTLAWTSDCGWT